MKKISMILSLAVLLVSCNGNSQNTLKRYEIKSGVVKYTTTITGKVLGGTVKGSGTEDLYFKNWGAVELKEVNSKQTTTMKFFGKKKVETTSTHTMNKLDNGESYLADFNTKTIIANRGLGMDLMKQSNKDAGEAGMGMLESIGGKKVGNESFLGHNCEIWDVNGAKQWMYKGVVLKLDITVFGIRTLTVATSAKFNVSLADSNFKLPDFPMQKQEGLMGNQEFEDEMDEMNNKMDDLSKLSYEEWKKMATKNDPEMREMSGEELRETYDMIQKMIKMKRGN